MTKIAFITDGHADVHALRDALRQIERLGVDDVVCCGDLVDYGLFPEETISLLRERSVRCIRGNHDRWAVRPGGAVTLDLSSESLEFLRALPTHWRAVVDGVRLVVAHGRLESDMDGIARDASDAELVEILRKAGAQVLVVGHTHVPFARRLAGRKLVANPGALLRDPGPGCEVATPGTFAVLDVARREFVVRHADGAPLIT